MNFTNQINKIISIIKDTNPIEYKTLKIVLI